MSEAVLEPDRSQNEYITCTSNHVAVPLFQIRGPPLSNTTAALICRSRELVQQRIPRHLVPQEAPAQAQGHGSLLSLHPLQACA